MKPLIDAYKDAVAKCTDPIGDYVNDNVMITNAVICMKDRKQAREIAMRADRGYLFSLVCLYHDTFPKPANAPVWPAEADRARREDGRRGDRARARCCAARRTRSPSSSATTSARGVDQLVFGFPNNLKDDEARECIELFGKKVIPSYDKDPVHRTTRFRESVLKR